MDTYKLLLKKYSYITNMLSEVNSNSSLYSDLCNILNGIQEELDKYYLNNLYK